MNPSTKPFKIPPLDIASMSIYVTNQENQLNLVICRNVGTHESKTAQTKNTKTLKMHTPCPERNCVPLLDFEPLRTLGDRT